MTTNPSSPRHSHGTRVQVFVGETDQVGRQPRYQAILEYLRREGAAGATVTRGIAGFGANSRIHTAAILRLSIDLPVVVTWVDAPGRVERLLPGLIELSGSGIVTVEEIGIAAYGGRRLEQLRFDLPVGDVMTQPAVTIRADAPVRAAVEVMLARGLRAVPVVDGSDRVVGLLSNGDLTRRAGLGARLELLEAMSAESRAKALAGLVGNQVVADAMTADPTTIGVDATLAAATHLMATRSLKRVPVVDGEGRVVGIISRLDVLRAVGETFPQAADTARRSGARTVGEIVREDAPTVSADADLAAVIDAIVSTRLNRAIVVDPDRRPLGVVSDADVIRSVDPSATPGVLGALMRTVGREPGSAARASDLIRRPLTTIEPAATIADAARLMIDEGRKVLCVVDDDGRLVGIVDRADLLRAAGSVLADLGAGPADRATDGDRDADDD